RPGSESNVFPDQAAVRARPASGDSPAWPGLLSAVLLQKLGTFHTTRGSIRVAGRRLPGIPSAGWSGLAGLAHGQPRGASTPTAIAPVRETGNPSVLEVCRNPTQRSLKSQARTSNLQKRSELQSATGHHTTDTLAGVSGSFSGVLRWPLEFSPGSAASPACSE